MPEAALDLSSYLSTTDGGAVAENKREENETKSPLAAAADEQTMKFSGG